MLSLRALVPGQHRRRHCACALTIAHFQSPGGGAAPGARAGAVAAPLTRVKCATPAPPPQQAPHSHVPLGGRRGWRHVLHGSPRATPARGEQRQRPQHQLPRPAAACAPQRPLPGQRSRRGRGCCEPTGGERLRGPAPQPAAGAARLGAETGHVGTWCRRIPAAPDRFRFARPRSLLVR